MEAQIAVRSQFLQSGGALRHGAEEVVDLAQSDDDGDTGGKAHHNGHGDEGGQTAQLQKTGGQQQDACGKAGEEHALQAVVHHDADQHGAHGAGGTGNLIGRTAQNGDDHAGDDGGDQTGSRGSTGTDAEGQSQRQSHGTDREAVLHQFCGVVTSEFLFQILKKCFKHKNPSEKFTVP